MIDRAYTNSDDPTEYTLDLATHFHDIPSVAKPLLQHATNSLKQIERLLYSAPAFINAIQASFPQESLQAILTNAQKSGLANGTLKLLTKKDGSLMANLIDPTTNKIVSSISLEKIQLTPELSQAITNYSTQMQLAQLAEHIRFIEASVEEVRQGQEYDRLATAYSCQQKLLQSMTLKNPQLRAMALLQIVSDAEDSRNLLMLSQSANIAFIQNQPESLWGKLISGTAPEKMNSRANELRESFCALSIVSLTEALAYQELGEYEAAQTSLQYYSEYIQKHYLTHNSFIKRLDMLDPSPINYWSKTLPRIHSTIQALPLNTIHPQIGGSVDVSKNMQEQEMPKSSSRELQA